MPVQLEPAGEVFGRDCGEALRPTPPPKKSPIISSPRRAGVGFQPDENGSR